MQSNSSHVITPPSSASSSSSSLNSSASPSNKKYNQADRHHMPSAKKRATINKHLHLNHHHHMNQLKPQYSEYLNAKCVLYVYFKGDILTAIDDHFQKSFSSFKTLTPPDASPSSSSSTSTTTTST